MEDKLDHPRIGSSRDESTAKTSEQQVNCNIMIDILERRRSPQAQKKKTLRKP